MMFCSSYDIGCPKDDHNDESQIIENQISMTTFAPIQSEKTLSKLIRYSGVVVGVDASHYNYMHVSFDTSRQI